MSSLTPDPSPVTRERGTNFDGVTRRPPQSVRAAARDLRKQATESEQALWSMLRNRRLGDRKFRRQHPIDRFVVDFCCLEEMLVVEIDGASHDGQEMIDLERERYIEALGFRFVRVSVEDINRRIAGVLELIQSSVADNSPLSRARERGRG